MIPFITSRSSTWRLLPPRLAGDQCSISAHSSSVRSLISQSLSTTASSFHIYPPNTTTLNHNTTDNMFSTDLSPHPARSASPAASSVENDVRKTPVTKTPVTKTRPKISVTRNKGGRPKKGNHPLPVRAHSHVQRCAFVRHLGQTGIIRALYLLAVSAASLMGISVCLGCGTDS